MTYANTGMKMNFTRLISVSIKSTFILNEKKYIKKIQLLPKQQADEQMPRGVIS